MTSHETVCILNTSDQLADVRWVDPSGNTALLGANLLFEMLCVLPGVLIR